MRVGGRWQGGAVVAAAAVWMLVAGSRAVAGDRQAPVVQQDAAPDPSEVLFKKVCSNCHPIEVVIVTRREREQWEELIEKMAGKMVEKGIKVTDDEFGTITDYVVGHYGRVNVNRAEDWGLVEVLGISDADAARIVAYRSAHGKFEDFDALVKVPEIDVATLTERRNEISF